MNTIASSVQNLAMDGQTVYNFYDKKQVASNSVDKNVAIQTRVEVVKNIEQNLAETKVDTQELQKLTEMVFGGKLRFSVNKELGSVVVTVVDSNTNQVIKEIPSEDIQNLKIRIRKAIGTLYDELI